MGIIRFIMEYIFIIYIFNVFFSMNMVKFKLL